MEGVGAWPERNGVTAIFIKRLLLTSLGTLVGIPSGVTLYGLMLGTEWRVERFVVIDAPISDIHPLVSSTSGWKRWGAGGKASLVEFHTAGPESGAGAELLWTGNGLDGSMKILAASEEEGVQYRQSFHGESSGNLRYERDQGGIKVTWLSEGVIGQRPFGGYFVQRMEKEQGKYEEGSLKRLKQMAEREGQEAPAVP